MRILLTNILLFVCTLIYAQKSVSGIVRDSDGLPLPGANVVQKGTSNGVFADIDGNYLITLNAEGEQILVFSFIGYSEIEIPINDRDVIEVTLKEDFQTLNEVVVVGYGTARRKDIAGSVSTIDMEDSPVSNIPSTNLLQSLQGKAAGLNISPQNTPGSTPGIIVRGQNSINGNNDPLIVVDGVVFLGSIRDINPNDIASFDILKDASSAAAYGSRSANGVIVITTKQGKSDKPTIRFNTTFGINTWNKKYDMMDLATYERKFAAQTGQEVGSIVFDDEMRNEYLRQRVDTDWMDFISRNGRLDNEQLSVSGRSDRMNYYFSLGHNKEEGVIKGDDYRRISLRAKLTSDITDWLQVGVDGSFNKNDYSGIGGNVRNAYLLAPIGYPYRYADMPFNVSSANSELLERWPVRESIQNPLWGTDGTVEDIDLSHFFKFTGFTQINIPFIEGLSYRLNYSNFSTFGQNDRFFYEDYYISEAGPGEYIERYSQEALLPRLALANGYNQRTKTTNYVIDHIVNYKRSLSDHYLDFTLVATRDKNYYKLVSLSGSDFTNIGSTELGVNGIHQANVTNTDVNVEERSNIGYLGRLGYTYKDRYHFTGSYRRDGSSVFGDNNKWGDFYSLALAWTITEESFFDINFIDYLKLKASYGQNGNQGVSPYGTLARVNSGRDGGIRYEFGDNPSQVLYGIQYTSLPNSSLGWETTTSLNTGFQSWMLNNRLKVDLDIYFSKTTDQIFVRRIPIMTGFESVISSLGQVNNIGYELTVETSNITNNDFVWSTGFSIWQNRNKIISLYGDDNDGDGVEDDDLANSLFIGKSLGAIYGYEYIGIVQEDDTDYIEATGSVPGDPMFADLNGDGEIDVDNDRKILGYRKENFRASLSNTFSYKNFNLYIQFNGIFGGGKENFFLQTNPKHNSFENRFDTNEINHEWWSEDNPSTEYLRPDYVGNRYLGLQSRNFLRLQDVTINYKIPYSLLEKLNIQTCSIFASARNVFTITSWYGGGDPEIGIRPGDGTYPVPTTYSAGINLSL